MSGINSEAKYKGAVFHVQTQDLGAPGRLVETLIYKSGKLLTSRRTSYASFLGSPELQEKIRQILEEQHSAILKEIAAGKFEHYLTAEEKLGPGDQA